MFFTDSLSRGDEEEGKGEGEGNETNNAKYKKLLLMYGRLQKKNKKKQKKTLSAIKIFRCSFPSAPLTLVTFPSMDHFQSVSVGVL